MIMKLVYSIISNKNKQNKSNQLSILFKNIFSKFNKYD